MSLSKKELQEQVKRLEMSDKIARWMLSGDTGISSETMAAIALGLKKRRGSFSSHFDAPHDGDDFGRCYRLVKAIPEIREHFPAIARKAPVFKGIISQWDELVKLYEKCRKDNNGSEIYKRINELRGDRPKGAAAVSAPSAPAADPLEAAPRRPRGRP